MDGKNETKQQLKLQLIIIIFNKLSFQQIIHQSFQFNSIDFTMLI